MEEISFPSTRKPYENTEEDIIMEKISLPSTREPSEDTEEDIIMEEISPSSTKKAKRIKHYASFGRRKVKKLKRKVHKNEEELNWYIDWCLTIITSICFALYQTSKFLFLDGKQKAIWTLFMLVASGFMFPNVVSTTWDI